MTIRKVSVFLANQANDYMQNLKIEAEATAARLGFEVEVSFAGTDPGRISLEQSQQVYRAVHREPGQKPVAVIILPLLDVTHTLREVVAEGVGAVVVNRLPPLIEELRSAHPGLPIFAVSSDQVQAGRLQGHQLRALLPGGGLVLSVRGNPLANSAVDRANGLREALDGTSIRTATVNGDWSPASGERVVTEWLRQPWNKKEKLAAIACQNDGMAAGARQAINKLSLSAPFAYLRSIPLLGIDGSPGFGLKMIDSGELTATVLNPPVTRTAIEMLAAALAGEKVPAFTTEQPKPHPAHLGAGGQL
jgi:ABC-type sugar transport system substrate-binding protein